MAQISITPNEIYNFAKVFDMFPVYVKNIKSSKNHIVANLKLLKFVPEIHISFKFEAYIDGDIIFGIHNIDKLLKLKRKPVKLYKDFVKIRDGQVVVSINKVIETKTDKIKIKNVLYKNEEFIIEI